MEFSKAWVVAADMGYGHQRAAFALKGIAEGKKIINANLYPGIPGSDKRIWEEAKLLYEAISRFKNIPVLGDFVFGIFDRFQAIEKFYTKTHGIDQPTLQLKQIYGLIENESWGKHLIAILGKKRLPLVATFPAVAFMAEHWGYEGPIWLVVTDADISRAWAPLDPLRTKIRYCASTFVAAERLEHYGIPKRNIFLTGFPLPDALAMNAREDVAKRLHALDPQGRYLKLYSDLVRRYLGAIPVKPKKTPELSITFAIGGAGAQEETGKKILQSMAPLLKKKKVKLAFVAGIREDAARFFEKAAKEQRLSPLLGTQLRILFAKTLGEYFRKFNALLRTSDILWTKPSELVFYSALGLPIILSEPVGSQEIENRKWLLSVGAGVDQFDPALTRHWLQDLLFSGHLAEAAMQGFVEVEKKGAGNIARLVSLIS